MKSALLEELDSRGLIFQTTHDELDEELAGRNVTLYCGFDPSADSLHVGSLLMICVLAHFRRHGHRPIVLVGGATGLIGDPSGKSEERNLLDDETIEKNLAGVGAQFRTILNRALEVRPRYDFVPQADSVETLAAVVETLADGPLSLAQVSERAELSSRNARFYAELAGWLGFARDGDEWSITDAGEAFLEDRRQISKALGTQPLVTDVARRAAGGEKLRDAATATIQAGTDFAEATCRRRGLAVASLMRQAGIEGDTAAGAEIELVNNADWIKRWSYIEFLRDVGKNFRVNVMLQKDSVKGRLEREETGISYTEFSYMLIQAYDFLHLYRERDCVLQIGGSDQWGNITAGIDLIRRKRGETAYGMTCPLILSAEGEKLGKTEKGAVWLDPEKTSPYEFYQYWVRREDSEVADLLRMFTFMPLDEIAELEATVERNENRGEVQRRLAHEVTWLVHGKEEADKAVRAAQMLYGEKIEGLSDRDLASVFADVPSTTITRDKLAAGINVVDLFSTETELQKSKGQARRLIQQGGGYINNQRVEDIDYDVSLDDLASETKLVLRAGKRNYHLVSVQ